MRLNHRDRILDGCGTRLLNDRLYSDTVCILNGDSFRIRVSKWFNRLSITINLPGIYLITFVKRYYEANGRINRYLVTIVNVNVIVIVVKVGSSHRPMLYTLLIFRRNHRDLTLWCRLWTWIWLCAVLL